MAFPAKALIHSILQNTEGAQTEHSALRELTSASSIRKTLVTFTITCPLLAWPITPGTTTELLRREMMLFQAFDLPMS